MGQDGQKNSTHQTNAAGTHDMGGYDVIESAAGSGRR